MESICRRSGNYEEINIKPEIEVSIDVTHEETLRTKERIITVVRSPEITERDSVILMNAIFLWNANEKGQLELIYYDLEMHKNVMTVDKSCRNFQRIDYS